MVGTLRRRRKIAETEESFLIKNRSFASGVWLILYREAKWFLIVSLIYVVWPQKSFLSFIFCYEIDIRKMKKGKA